MHHHHPLPSPNLKADAKKKRTFTKNIKKTLQDFLRLAWKLWNSLGKKSCKYSFEMIVALCAHSRPWDSWMHFFSH